MTNTDLVGLIDELSTCQWKPDQEEILKIIHDLVVSEGEYYDIELYSYDYQYHEMKVNCTGTPWGLITYVRVWYKKTEITITFANGSFLDNNVVLKSFYYKL